jgi:hypothetical protein
LQFLFAPERYAYRGICGDHAFGHFGDVCGWIAADLEVDFGGLFLKGCFFLPEGSGYL